MPDNPTSAHKKHRHGSRHGARRKADGGRSAYMSSLLQEADKRTAPSAVLVVFENQMALAEGGRRVIKVPKSVLYDRLYPPQWGFMCPSMAAVDVAISKQREKDSAGGFCFYDGFDVYATEAEARDTRFAHPLITRPNPVYDANMCTDVFTQREVFKRTASDTIITVLGDENAGGGGKPAYMM